MAPDHELPRCPGCGYVLLGLPQGKCPECGRAFSVGDPALFGSGASRLCRLVAGLGPHRFVNWLAVAGTVIVAVVLGSPNGQVSDVAAAFLALLIVLIGGGWSVSFVVHLMARAALPLGRQTQPRWRWGWLAIPALFVVGGWLQGGGMWWMRWVVARGSLDAVVASGTPIPAGGRWVRGFHVVGEERWPDGSIRYALGFPDLYSDGRPTLVYSRSKMPQLPWGPQVVPLGGGWWLFWDNT